MTEGEFFEAVRSIIYKRVSSQVDTHFIDRIHLVGDGTASPEIEAQQRMRVLIQARHGFIPVVFRTDYRGNLIRDKEMYLLSSRAAADAREEGLLHWYCSVFGDELHLTPKGRDAAKDAWREYRVLCRKWIASERERRIQLAAYRAESGRRAIEGGER